MPELCPFIRIAGVSGVNEDSSSVQGVDGAWTRTPFPGGVSSPRRICELTLRFTYCSRGEGGCGDRSPMVINLFTRSGPRWESRFSTPISDSRANLLLRTMELSGARISSVAAALSAFQRFSRPGGVVGRIDPKHQVHFHSATLRCVCGGIRFAEAHRSTPMEFSRRLGNQLP